MEIQDRLASTHARVHDPMADKYEPMIPDCLPISSGKLLLREKRRGNKIFLSNDYVLVIKCMKLIW